MSSHLAFGWRGGAPRQILLPSFEAGHSSFGLQIKYSLIERTVKRELIPMSKSLNLGVLAWSPLAKGVLSGKYHGEGKANGGRMSNEGMKEFVPEEQHTTRIISAVKAVSKPNGGSCRIGPALAEIVARFRRVP